MSGDGDIIGVHSGPALSRHTCPACGPESLHRGDQCVHCGRRLGTARPVIAAAIPKRRRRRTDFTVSPKASTG